MATVSFVKGTYAKYQAGKSTYDSNGSLFFCTDKPVLYANGMGIGLSDETLAEYFDGVKDVAYEPSTGVFTISYFKTGKANKTFTLKQLVYEGSQAITVTGTDSKTIALKINEANKVLSQSADGLTTTLSFKKNEAGQSMQLVGIDDAYIAEFSYADFVVDGMLQSVDYNKEDPNKLDFVWNTAAGSKTMSIDLSKYIDTYEAGDGLDLNSKVFSVKVKEGEKYLKNSSNGLYTEGIDTIKNAVDSLTNILDELDASKVEATPVGEGSATDVQGVLEELNESIQGVASSVISVTEGNGISITGTSTKTVAAKVKSNDPYIEVTEDGIASKGIDTAITTKATEIVSNALTWVEA